MIKWRRVIYLAVAGILASAAISFFPFGRDNHGKNKMQPEKEILLNNTNKSGQNVKNEPDNIANAETKVKSAPVRDLPWINEKPFLDACEANGTRVLMAAYRTVLRDPLPGEEYNVHLAAGMLAGKIIKPGQVFSQNSEIGPYTEGRGFQKGPTYIGNSLTTTIGGGVCKIASTLYNVVILSNLQVVERHNHSMPVPYVPYGQDATVAYGARDLKFRNNTAYPIMIWARGIDNILYMAFYGSENPPGIEWHHEIYDIRKAQKVYRKNSKLPAGTEKVVLEGMDGATVKSWLTVYKHDGSAEEKKLGLSHYSPMDFIIETNK